MNFMQYLFLFFCGTFLLLPTSGQAQSLNPLTLRFAYQDRLGSVIPAIAVQQGFFQDEGLEVITQQFNSGPACAEALYSGSADLAGMGDTAALIMAARLPNIRILASHATGEHRHRVMVKAGSPLRTLQDLAGKSVGLKKGTSTHGGLLLALTKAQVPRTALTFVDLTPPTQVEALAAGSIDAFAASEPTPAVAEMRGAKELATLGGLGNEYPILLVAKDSWIKANTESLTRFFRALRRAQAYTADHPDEIVALMARQSGLDPKATRQAMARHNYALRLDQAIISSLEQTAAFLAQEKIIEHAPDLAVVIEDRFLR